MAIPAKVFLDVGKAIEGEALTPQTAQVVAQSVKKLLQATNLDPTPILQKEFPPKAQQAITAYFA